MKDLTSFPPQNNSSPSATPVVALVGRPNVGKSTLFNRLIGKRRAITDPTPGVTRDPVKDYMEVEGRKLLLLDTGGYQTDPEGLNPLVTRKSLETLKAADLILFIMDVTEVTPLDMTLSEELRPYSDKVVLVVNKVDSEIRDPSVWEFHSLGFDRIISLSAAHGRGCDSLYDFFVERFGFTKEIPVEGYPMQEEGTKQDKSIGISIMGKPNTGKSTLINTLLGYEQSIVSDIPGTTRDTVPGTKTYKGWDLHFLDTAGIRRKNKVEENVEYYSVNRAIKSIEDSEIILLMIDSVEGLTEQDKKIADLAVKKGRGIILVLNKWDLLEPLPNRLQAYKDRIGFLFPVLSFAPIIPISALKGEGIQGLLNSILAVQRQLVKRIETGKLNRALSSWITKNPPPRNRSLQYKVKYITQVTVNPLRFVAFVNRRKGFPKDYLQYLINSLRKDFDFSKVPLSLELSER